jgi:ketosteroid isomerase-like protein
MRRVFYSTLIVSLALSALIGCAQSMTSPTTQHSEEQRVLAAEDEYVAAEVSRDEAALRRLVDDRFQYNTARGATTDKEELIASLLKMNMVDQKIKERSLLIQGDIALVFGTAEIRFAIPGKPESISTLRYTATYVSRQGQWRLLALQMQQRASQ